MKNVYATCSQRFLAYLLDSIIMGIVSSIILCNLPVYKENMDIINHSLEMSVTGTMDLNILLGEIMQSFYTIFGYALLIEGVLMAFYMVILPYFWKYQTLGRLATHTKVIRNDGSKVNFGNLLLREYIGGFLLLQLVGSFIIPLVTWYLSATSGRSLGDMIGGTSLIDTKYHDSDYEQKSNHDSNDYIDASFKEQKDPQEEYKVF